MDVLFNNSSGAPDTTPPVISQVAAASASSTSETVTWTTDEASTSVVSYGTSAASLTGNASASGMVTSHSVTLTGLTAGTVYYFRVTSADAANNSSTSPVTSGAPATFTTAAASSCPCSVFSASSTPGTVDSGDGAAVELGMKFVPSVSGTVTAVRFYKAATNTGSHTGSLWSSTGTRLATGTFSGETASGWQTLTFASAVSVTAGTTYVVSYYAPAGHYSVSSPFFTAAVTSGPLTAPAAGNGLYMYGGGFPTNTFNASNYWVDVVLTTP